MDVRKTLAAAGLVVAVGSLTACGGGSSSTAGGGSGAPPTDASKSDFCGMLQNSGSNLKPSQVAATMSSVGTPSDISASARHGFEVLVDKMSQITSNNPSDSDLAKLSQDFQAQDLSDVQAFLSYYVSECTGGLPSSGSS
jgi:hypothetical protein